MTSKDGKYPPGIFKFNDLWRIEMEELHFVLKNKGFKEDYKKPTFHPLHTQKGKNAQQVLNAVQIYS